MRTITRLVTAVLAAVIAVLLGGTLLAPAAQAQKLTIDDGYDAGEFVEDIDAIRVTHGPRNLFVRVKYYPRVGNWSMVDAWVDTDASDPGPEFALTHSYYAPRKLSVTRVDNFNWGGEDSRNCDPAASKNDDGELLMSVPRRCLKIDGKAPAKVRVTVHSYDDEFMDETEDWAPFSRAFGKRWVRSS